MGGRGLDLSLENLKAKKTFSQFLIVSFDKFANLKKFFAIQLSRSRGGRVVFPQHHLGGATALCPVNLRPLQSALRTM